MLPSQIIRKDAAFFGRLAVLNRMVSQKQMEEAILILAKLKRMGIRRRLKDVLIERGWVAPAEMVELEEIQARSQALPADVEEGVYVAPQDVERFARIAMDHDLVPMLDLQEARDTCAKMRELGLRPRLGVVLREKGYLSDAIVRTILERKLRASLVRPATVGLGLCALLVAGGLAVVGPWVKERMTGTGGERQRRADTASARGVDRPAPPDVVLVTPQARDGDVAPGPAKPASDRGDHANGTGAAKPTPAVEPAPIWPAGPTDGPPEEAASCAEPAPFPTYQPGPEELMATPRK